jgi:glycosyltransferase involved in cell wall biosynthesis
VWRVPYRSLNLPCGTSFGTVGTSGTFTGPTGWRLRGGPHVLWLTSRWWLLDVLAKVRRTRIVWTLHNLSAHNRIRPCIDGSYMSWFSRHVDGVICRSPRGLEAGLRRFPRLRDKSSTIAPIGHYLGAYPSFLTRDEARARLRINATDFVFAFVGRISAY